MQTRATHPKTARREAKSDKKKEERIGAQLMAEITEPIDDTATAAAISDPAWKPSSSHLPTTPDAYASRAQGAASASHAASYAFTTLPAWDPIWSPCDHTCDKSHSISSAVHRLAGQLVEHGVPSRVALVLARNGVEPKDLASTPIEEALSVARAESITLNSIEERKLRTLCAQAVPSAATAAPTITPEPNAAIAPADWPSQDEIVYLSVGGTPFTTRRSTLCRVPDSALANLFTLDNGFREPDKDKSGAYFLDCDPSVFAWLLCYLRLEQQLYDLPPTDIIRSVRMEANFWGLKGLVDILDASLAQPCLADQRVEAVRFVNDGPNLCSLLHSVRISQAVRRAIAAVYIRASEDEFGQPIFVAHGFSNLVLHNIFDKAASGWMVCDSAAKTRDNIDRSLLRCMAEVKFNDRGLEPAHTGVWMVRVCTSEEQCHFCEVPELALRLVPRSIALSLEVPVQTDDVE